MLDTFVSRVAVGDAEDDDSWMILGFNLIA
jgi:hypothetical protein